MSNTFKLTTTPLGLGTQSGRNPSTVFKLKNSYIAIPLFSVTGIPDWPGSSYVAARVSLILGVQWSIVMPITAGGNYCPAIYFGGTRYKLSDGIGETLDYPLYAGQPLPATEVVLEFWTINDEESVMSQPATWYIPMSLLAVPTDWNDQSRSIYTTSSAPISTTIPYTL